MLMHAALRFTEDIFSTDICPMSMDYAVWVYNRIPDMQSGLSAIEIWSRSRFEPVSETLSSCHVWGCPTYVLEPKLQKPGVKIPKWAPRSRRGVNMVFSKDAFNTSWIGSKPLNRFNFTTVSCCI